MMGGLARDQRHLPQGWEGHLQY